jgi:hypothetical protein
MSIADIHSILVNVSVQINTIEHAVSDLSIKLCKLEKQMEQMQQQETHTQVAMITSISSSEEKIKLLNQQTKVDAQEDLISAIKTRCTIDKSGVLSILNGHITIYEYIVDVVYDFNTESQSKFLYGFSDSKSNMYFWNHVKKTWAKMTKSYLHQIFMILQQKIIIKYNVLMNDDDSLKKGCVENGDLIFADDFEKRHGDFKKTLISRFV